MLSIAETSVEARVGVREREFGVPSSLQVGGMSPTPVPTVGPNDSPILYSDRRIPLREEPGHAVGRSGESKGGLSSHPARTSGPCPGELQSAEGNQAGVTNQCRWEE